VKGTTATASKDNIMEGHAHHWYFKGLKALVIK